MGEKRPVSEHIICGLWGTTSLQISCVNTQMGEVVERRSGRGVSKLQDRSIEEEFFTLCKDWIADYGINTAFLGGMAGSSLGWWDVPYLTCPASPSDLSKHVSHRLINGVNIHIVPGLRCENFLGEPDVMRGEEVEILAWLKMNPLLEGQNALICIPGTHTKWVYIQNGKIQHFQTSIIGELFDVICANGVLAKKHDGEELDREAFLGGVESSMAYPQGLLQLLMSVRARSLLQGQSATAAPERLSGLLIGADIVNISALIGSGADALPITIIGAPYVAERYALALEHVGKVPMTISAEYMGIRGLFELSKDLMGVCA